MPTEILFLLKNWWRRDIFFTRGISYKAAMWEEKKLIGVSVKKSSKDKGKQVVVYERNRALTLKRC